VACITHTNAGADEIDSRLRRAAFSGEDQYYQVATIHSFALQNVLQPFHRLLGPFANGFSVLTSDDEPFQLKRAELIQKHRLPSRSADLFDSVQREPDGTVFVPDDLPLAAGEEWCKWCDQNAYTTLGDIVYHSCRIASQHDYVASALASRFAWILVDEFQDSSPGQVYLFKRIFSYGRTRYFCVGDPNQSIYGFAGASPALLYDFASHISAATHHRLTGNFRSSQLIVDVAERLCPTSPAMQAVGADKDYPAFPAHHHVTSTLEGILTHFLPAVTRLNVPLGKVAILAPWWLSLFLLARELRSRNIPVIGPGARPYKRSHLFSRLAEPVGAYLESPEADIAVTVQRSVFHVLSELTGQPRRDIFSYKGRVAICQILQVAAVTRQDAPLAVAWLKLAAERFADTLVRGEFCSPSQCTALMDSANCMSADLAERDREGRFSVEDLGIFARPQNCIQLLTIHKAKGREFQAVAIVDAHDGRLPHFSIRQTSDPLVQRLKYEEARRLVYVAATRAEKLLMVFTDSSDYRNRATPFLAEMGL
jgi:DNA helicase-2/ATP-dependent DNA helicase PcrA